MRNYYEGWSEEDLLTERRRLVNQSSSGQVIRSSIAGVSVERATVTGGAATQDITSARVQYALWLIGRAQVADGVLTINPYENPYTQTIKRTRASYL